jgi:hypothetical protein
MPETRGNAGLEAIFQNVTKNSLIRSENPKSIRVFIDVSL